MMRVIILAGGRGERLWPLSNADEPKQFIDVVGGRSFLTRAVERALQITEADEIFVVTSKKHIELARLQIEPLNASVHILSEPEGKNTAPAIALGIHAARREGMAHSADLFLVLSSDHLIQGEERFVEHCQKAAEKARLGSMVAFGAPAVRAETGYGYLKEENGRTLFIEKPDKERAEAFVKSGDYMWNCGMFAFEFSAFIRESEKHLPALGKIVYAEDPTAAFLAAPKISFDHGIMEKSEHVAAMRLDDVRWSDVGSFDELFRVMQKDDSGNVVVGDVDLEEVRGSLIIGFDKPIAVLGCENLCIIDRPEALLIADLERAQEVKRLAARSEATRTHESQKIALEPSEEREAPSGHHGLHWIVVDGLAEVMGEKFGAGQSVFVPPRHNYTISNQGSQILEILEVRLAGRSVKYLKDMRDCSEKQI